MSEGEGSTVQALATDELRLLHQTIREFARSELRPHAAGWDAEGRFPTELVPKLADLGLLGMTVPVEYGGSGLPAMAIATAIEALAWGDGGVALSVNGTFNAAQSTLDLGSGPASSVDLTYNASDSRLNFDGTTAGGSV